MNCPVCLDPGPAPALTGADILFETTSRLFRLSGCGACRSLFIDPSPGEAEIATFCPAQYWWKPSPGVLKTLERIYRGIALRDHIGFIVTATRHGRHSGPVRILDVGCGPGT